MARTLRHIAAGALLLALGACAGHRGTTTPRGDRSVITRATLLEQHFTTAYDAVEALHSDWLRTHGSDSVASPSVIYVHARPTLPAQPTPAIPTHGNFTVRDDFSARTLAPYWLQMRTPREPSIDLTSTPGWLTLAARPVALSSRGQPSFVGRRQQHLTATATTAMRYVPAKDGDRAGLVAFQGENFHYFLAVTRVDGKPVVQVIERAGRATATPTP